MPHFEANSIRSTGGAGRPKNQKSSQGGFWKSNTCMQFKQEKVHFTKIRAVRRHLPQYLVFFSFVLFYTHLVSKINKGVAGSKRFFEQANFLNGPKCNLSFLNVQRAFPFSVSTFSYKNKLHKKLDRKSKIHFIKKNVTKNHSKTQLNEKNLLFMMLFIRLFFSLHIRRRLPYIIKRDSSLINSLYFY